MNSPYIGFGVELDTKIEHEHFYKNDSIQYKFDSQDISEYNLLKYFFRLENDEIYDFMTKKSEGETEENDKEKKEDKIAEKNTKSIEEDMMSKVMISETPNKQEGENKLLQGFKNSKYETKIHMLSGDLSNLSKKKKFKNIFDVVLIGFQSKNLFSTIPNLAKNEETDIFLELNSHMISFNEKDKEKYTAALIGLAKTNGLIINENMKVPYMNHYHFKADQIQPTQAPNEIK